MYNKWAITEYDRIDASDSAFSANVGGSITKFSWTSSTYIPAGNLPVNIMTRGIYYGPGGNYAAQLESWQTFGLGYAVRMRTYTSYDYTSYSGASPAIINVEWVGVRKCSLNEPIATLTRVITQTTTGSISQNQIVVHALPVLSGAASMKTKLKYSGSDIRLVMVDPTGAIVPSNASYVQYLRSVTTENWTISEPMAGNYTIYVLGINVTESSENFTLTAEIDIPVALDVNASLLNNAVTIFDNQTADYPVAIENNGLLLCNITIGTEGVDIASVTFINNGTEFNGTLVIPPNSSAIVDVILSPMADGINRFNITVTPVDGNYTFAATCTVNIDDTTPPVITVAQINSMTFNPAGGVDLNFTINATDPESGIDTSRVYIAIGSTVFTTLGTHVVNLPAIGTYTVDIRIPNARVRFGKMDSLWHNSTSLFVLDIGTVLNILNNTVAASPASVWLNTKDKETMLDRISELYLLYNAGDIHGTYVMLLNDIKPELTGLKTDENEEPFDGCICTHLWVTNAALRAVFRSGCDLLLQGIKSSDPIAMLVSQLKAQCNVASWDKPNHEQAMLGEINKLNNLLNAGNYQDATDMLLNDIEPKLFGVSTAGTLRCCFDGRFSKPWVTNAASQAAFKNLCNMLLGNMTTVAPSTYIINQMVIQCNTASWGNATYEQAMLGKLNTLQALITSKQYGRAEDLLLNDIEPKLVPSQHDCCGGFHCGCLCSKPWVTDAASQAQFRIMCNALLMEIQFHTDDGCGFD